MSGRMNKAATLTFHGAAGTVTGSCTEVRLGDRRILIDCGLFQGTRSLEALNREPFEFDPRSIDAVVLTHGHIDHSGLLPRLVREGFAGPVWCSAPTLDLLGALLPDAARIQQADAERHNRRPDRRGEPPFLPLYTEADAERCLALLRSQDLGTWFAPAERFRARFWNAGHILGSCSVELLAGDVRLLFSGDLGPDHKAFHPSPAAPRGFDHIICESTYGNRDRPRHTAASRLAELGEEIKGALAAGGNLVIPAFAVERTQELLLDIATLINRGQLPRLTVFIDSPLASRVTAAYAKHASGLEDLDNAEIFRHPAFHYVEDVQQSIRLNGLSGAVILAASGMCEAGRVRHHLLHNLPRGDSTILFVGFQAPGTLGRTILDGAPRVRMSGRDVAVRARIRRIESYSAHADRHELADWLAARLPISGSLFVNHGEAAALAGLKQAAETADPGASVLLPAIGERYALAVGTPARRLRTGRRDIAAVTDRDWQNDYADFAVRLKGELQNIDAQARREALERMRKILEDYRHRRARRGRGR